MRPILLLTLLASPAFADSEASWDQFRAAVSTACLALVTDPGARAIDVNPFGSAQYGIAIVTLAADTGTDRMVCIHDKATKVAEFTAPFMPLE